jgi:hypothetical protein
MVKNPATAHRDVSASTAYSRARYAHPFFLPAAPAARQAFNGHHRMTQWSKGQTGPIPPIKRDGIVDLTDIVGAEGVREIEQLGEIRFHALGDTGVNHAVEAEHVADDMTTDYKPGAGALNPAFLFHLGDIVYGPDKDSHYADRFYRPYRRYPGKIIAIPGNHDGESKSPADSPSLKAFIANFCADTPAVPPQASGSGIFRETMTLPGAYWLLDAPFVRIIGLYSNRVENPGFLEGDGGNDTSQLDWLEKTLKSIARKDKKALVIATHHPPFSAGGHSHSGSEEMRQSIDTICDAARVLPDAFLSAHAHNYQRYTRRRGGKQIPYIVAGTGGIGTQGVPDASGEPAGSPDTTYDASLQSHGYLFVTASKQQLKCEFWRAGPGHTQPFDPLTIDLATGVLTRG